MKKNIMLLFLLAFTSVGMWAQKVTVSGTVMEEDTGEPVFSASVVLLKPDSSMVVGASSKMDGKFSLSPVKPGNYIFRITYVGLEPYFKNMTLTSKQQNVALGQVKMKTNAVVLKGAEVTARQAQVEMKADTFVYNAGAYRLPEGSALEELVKKLPGAEVTDDGTIKINGKEVKKIMVDGKEFFNNDTKMAMKNLPTNMVEKIKAYDRQSDYTRTTGIDDGEEETVLDIGVKKGMNQGWIGNIDLGYGTEERYTGKMMAARFTDQLHLAIIGSANNVNDRGFGGGGFRGWGGGGGGLVASKMAGVNVNWNNGLKEASQGWFRIGGNVRYSHNNSDALSRSNSETFLTGNNGSSFSNSMSHSVSKNTNINGDVNLEWTPDTMTRIQFRPNFSYSESDSWSKSSSVTFNSDPYAVNRVYTMTNPLEQYNAYLEQLSALTDATAADSIVVNDNIRESMSNSKRTSVDGSLMVNRKLNSKGRNMTLRLSGGYSDSKSYSHSASDINYFLREDADVLQRQYNVNPSKNYNYRAELSYSEPLFAGAHLQFRYSYQYRYSDSDRSMYSLDSLVSKGYIDDATLMSWNLGYVPLDGSEIDAALTGIDLLELCKNARNSQYATYKEHNQNANIMFRYNKGKIRLNAGVSVQPQKTYMDYEKNTLDTSVVRTVVNWAPRIDFRYKFSDTGQLRLRYNGRSSQPSMTNLLDVTDDSNPLYVSKGNPGLEPSWSNNFNLFYNNYIADLQRGWMVHANASMTQNSISTAQLYDVATGKTTSMPMNIDGNWNAGVGGMFNTALGEKKYFNISSFTNYNYSNNVGYISSGNNMPENVSGDDIVNMSQKSTTKSMNISERLNLNFRNDLLEVGVNGNINYQHARNDMQENANLDTYNFSYGGNLQINAPWNMSLSTDIGQESRRGYDDASMNTNELIWNAQLSQSFLKQNAATVTVQWYDILQQRSSISRSISATRRSDSWSNAIHSYVMVHFIYKLNLFGNKEARQGMHGMGGPEGPGGRGGFGGRRPGGFGGGFGGPR